MKKSLVTALVLGIGAAGAAHAGSNDDVAARLTALEKENAAIRKENAALRQNKSLREQNATLKSSTAATPVAAAQPGAKRSDPFGAFAADLPLAYKARPVESPGQFRVWGEGGAVWSGGDPALSDYYLSSVTSVANRTFDLQPKVGWEAAGGFDYRFAASPWHINGQFRYGEGRGSGTDGQTSSAGAPIGNNNFLTLSRSNAVDATNTETHWLADLGVGYDVLGHGQDAMQVKFGLRIAEYKSILNNSNVRVDTQTFAIPFNLGGVNINTIGSTTLDSFDQRATFLGAGPRIGIEGAVPFAGGWSFDYQGDAAVLFGTQRLTQVVGQKTLSVTPAAAADLGDFNDYSSSSSLERFATVFNADIQVGVSYWMTPNLKLSASYRLDAYFNVLNQTTTPDSKQTLDRYIHGPRLGVSATF